MAERLNFLTTLIFLLCGDAEKRCLSFMFFMPFMVKKLLLIFPKYSHGFTDENLASFQTGTVNKKNKALKGL